MCRYSASLKKALVKKSYDKQHYDWKFINTTTKTTRMLIFYFDNSLISMKKGKRNLLKFCYNLRQ